ncbi:hypothetical protein D9M71_767630 [compost metagenome]
MKSTETKGLKGRLQAMAAADNGRSETARLRDVFEDVERALQVGVSRKAVLDVLHQDGFTMTAKSFESALYRIRKQRKAVGHGQPAKPVPAKRPAQTEDFRPPTFTHNPTPPDNILD